MDSDGFCFAGAGAQDWYMASTAGMTPSQRARWVARLNATPFSGREPDAPAGLATLYDRPEAWERSGSNIEFTDQFAEWFQGLEPAKRELVRTSIDMLDEAGHLGLTTKKCKTLQHVKGMRLMELRHTLPVRAFFTHDPLNKYVLLTGGDKKTLSGGTEARFYAEKIHESQGLYLDHLVELRNEGLIDLAVLERNTRPLIGDQAASLLR